VVMSVVVRFNSGASRIEASCTRACSSASMATPLDPEDDVSEIRWVLDLSRDFEADSSL